MSEKKQYRDDIPLELYCPICGEKMCTDVHAPEDGAKWSGKQPEYNHPDELRYMDNWICFNEKCSIKHCVVFGREDIEEWME